MSKPVTFSPRPVSEAVDTSFNFGANAGKRKNFSTGRKRRVRTNLTRTEKHFQAARGGSGE